MNRSKFVYLVSLTIIFIYLFLSIYETYILELVGHITRPYLILFVVFLFFNIRRTIFKVDQLLLMIWLLFYCLSLLWTPNIGQASLYVGTIIIMTTISILCGSCYFSKDLVRHVVELYKWCSVSLATLGLFFSEPISVHNTVRMALTIGGVQADPNNLVALYTIGSGLTLFSLKKGGRHVLINLIGLLICVYSILITGSRSGILILGVQFLIWFFYANKEARVVVKIIVSAIIVAIAGYIMFTYVNVETLERILGTGDLAFTDSTGRDDYWRTALNLFKASPILGHGWGAYPAHNTFLTILVDIGIVGLGLLLVYMARLFLRIIKCKNDMALVIFCSGVMQSFLLDAQNKRFFWNIIILSVLIINSYADSSKNTKFY